jgi:hypothetical protein
MINKSVQKALSPNGGGPLPNPGPGRPKGSINKIARAAKENIEIAFDRLGGIEGLVKWAGKNDHNRGIFYQSLYSKILPLSVHGHVDIGISAKEIYDAEKQAQEANGK